MRSDSNRTKRVVKGNHRRLLKRAGRGFETLEARRYLAGLYLNEVHFDPLFGSNEKDQYVEIRGEPGATIPDDTYMVVLEGSSGLSNAGHIHTMFDLSNQALGSNGMLVLLEAGHRYAVDAGARKLVGTDGFKGMPGDIFSTENSLSNHIDFIVGANSYLLIQSVVKPNLGDDIDTNDDGVPDQLYSGWTVLDGFAALPWVDSVTTLVGYAPIVFRENNPGIAPLAKTIVDTEQLAYAGRIGDSVGYSKDEWVTGNTTDSNSNGSPAEFRLEHGTFGTPRPYVYAGRHLDHVGSSNFSGSASGKVFQDWNGDGVQQAGENALGGVSVTIDANGDGTSVPREFQLEPDLFDDGEELTNASPGVTLTVGGSDNKQIGFKVRAEDPTNSNAFAKVLASEGIPWFDDSGRLRMDFYWPASEITVRFTGTSGSATYGRIEAYDVAGNSLGFVRTNALGSSQSTDLTLTIPSGNIAYAVAYCDDTYLDSSPFGRLDNLRYKVPDLVVKTGADGTYAATKIVAGDYSISAAAPSGMIQQYPVTPPYVYGLSVERAESRDDANFSFLPNRAPEFADQTFVLQENQANGFEIGAFAATDTDLGQTTTYTIVSGDPNGVFGVSGGKLVLLKSSAINYEQTTSYVFQVRASDNFSPPATTEATVTVTITDGNDVPVVASKSVSVSEHEVAGTVLAQMSAQDEDAGSNLFTYSILEGNNAGRFAIDPASGEVSVAGGLDFETSSTYSLVIGAQDLGTPRQTGRGTLTINLTDINEAPVLVTTDLSFVENPATGALLPDLQVNDPDLGQNLTLSVIGGSAAAWLDVVSANRQLRVKAGANFDFESQTDWTVELRVEDSGTPKLSATKMINLHVLDGNDAPVISSTGFSVAENSPSSVLIGTLESSDQDVGQTTSYAIVDGQDSGKFRIESATGKLYPAEGVSLNFESRASYVIRVRATDSGANPASVEKQITIDLTDENEAPSVGVNQFSLDEDAGSGEVVGMIVGQDPDSGSVLRYSMTMNDWFEVDSATGEVRVKAGASLNFEQASSHLVDVQIEDQQGMQGTGKVTVSIRDVNEAPQLVGSIPDMEIRPSAPWNYTIPAGLFVDGDAGDTLLILATDGAGFSLPTWIQFSNGTFSATPSLSQVGTYSIRVVASDKGRLAVSDTFVLDVKQESNWHNPELPIDADRSNTVTGRDALVILNYLNAGLPSDGPAQGGSAEFAYDVTNDGKITPQDVLLVLNHLNFGAEGEGEGRVGASVESSTALRDEDFALLAWDFEQSKRRNR